MAIGIFSPRSKACQELFAILCDFAGVEVLGTKSIAVEINMAEQYIPVFKIEKHAILVTAQAALAKHRSEPTATHNDQPAPVCPKCNHAYPSGDEHVCEEQ